MGNCEGHNSHWKYLSRNFYMMVLGLLSVACTYSEGVAQDSLTNIKRYPPIRIYQAGYTAGPIVVHTDEIQSTKTVTSPFGLELTMAWQRNDQDAWNKCGCNPTQGIQLAYYDYNNVTLGRSLNLSYVLEPTYALSERSSFSYRVIFGIAYMTNPYNSSTNPSNQLYSTSMNAFFGPGVGYWRHLSDHSSAGLQIEFHHISNGGNETPNKGINWLTAGLTLRYQTNPRPLQTFHREPYLKSKRVLYDLSIFGVTKKLDADDGSSSSYLLAGVAFQAAKRVGRINNLTLSTEVFLDNSLRNRLLQDNSELDPWRVDFMVGHEFVLGRLLFSQRLGVYIYQAGHYYDPFFHQWGLTYRIRNHWSLGMDLKVHREVADYWALRFSYTF